MDGGWATKLLVTGYDDPERSGLVEIALQLLGGFCVEEVMGAPTIDKEAKLATFKVAHEEQSAMAFEPDEILECDSHIQGWLSRCRGW